MADKAHARGPERFAQVTLPLLGLAVFINYVDRGNLGTAIPLMEKELDLTATEIGVLTAAFFWSYTPAQLLAGWMTERFNAYRTLAIGLAIWGLATFATGFAGGFASVLVLRLLLGVGESAAFPCSSKLIAQHVHGHRLGAANAVITQGLSLGTAFGVFFGGLLMAQFGWRNLFILFGAVSLLWLIPWIAATRGQTSLGEAGPVQAQAQAQPTFLAIVRRRELWGAVLGHLAANFGFYFVMTWLPRYLVNARGYSIPQMAVIGGLVYLVYAGAAIVSGLLVDRWVASGGSPSGARKTVGLVCFLGAAVALVTCAYADGDISLAALLVAAFLLGGLGPHVFAVGQILAGPAAAGKWTGVQNCFANFSGMVGPVITGIIIDHTGGYGGAFVLAAGVTLAGVIGWVLMIPRIAPLAWRPEEMGQASKAVAQGPRPPL